MQRTPHEGHGPHLPRPDVPARPLGSVRRTTTIDMRRPDGLDGPLLLEGHGRDLLTRDDGAVQELGTAGFRARVGAGARPLLEDLRTTPARPAAAGLVGTAASAGFRAALAAALPQEMRDATLLHLLLDDLPVTAMVSGYAAAVDPPPGRSAGRPPPADVCSGWRSGGTMMLALTRRGSLPPLAGPSVPQAEAARDPLGSHPAPPVPRLSMRRHRRLDVHEAGGLLHVDAGFRDSYADADGDRTVVHEYGLSAEVDPDGLVLLRVQADPRVLPWTECPVAAASAPRLVGMTASEVRARVRSELTGISTCTHLNDLLRSLGDLVGLVPQLRAVASASS